MILRRTPDPREIPKHAPLLFGSEPPVHLLDQLTAGAGDHELHALACAPERTHVRGREITRDVEGMALAQILASTSVRWRIFIRSGVIGQFSGTKPNPGAMT